MGRTFLMFFLIAAIAAIVVGLGLPFWTPKLFGPERADWLNLLEFGNRVAGGGVAVLCSLIVAAQIRNRFGVELSGQIALRDGERDGGQNQNRQPPP